eukprot:2600580-Amphidinium_carterae.1
MKLVGQGDAKTHVPDLAVRRKRFTSSLTQFWIQYRTWLVVNALTPYIETDNMCRKFVMDNNPHPPICPTRWHGRSAPMTTIAILLQHASFMFSN